MQFSSGDTDRIKLFYQKLLKQYGQNDPRSLNWINAYTQTIRFEKLLAIGDLEKCSVLDVGCGLGDLFSYLKQRVNSFEYVGVDIVNEMIFEAHKRCPEADFRILDFSHGIAQTFDYVLSSGALSYKIENHGEVYQSMIGKMFASCKKGVAFNMLDKRRHPDDEIFASYDPAVIYDFCQSLTDKLVLRHDYLEYDFTIYLYR